jgi:hypothetical protein
VRVRSLPLAASLTRVASAGVAEVVIRKPPVETGGSALWLA